MSVASSFRLEGQFIALTGASSGIGAAIAEALYNEGANICIGSRRQDKLDAVAESCRTKSPGSPGKVVTAICDVTDRTSVQNFLENAKKEFGTDAFDAVVNSAGVMYFTKMKNANMDQWDEMIDVNCRGATNLFGCVIPGMVAKGKGRIVTISSDAGVRGFPNLAVYCATKYFLETLAEVTRRELVGTGVTLSTVLPGDTKGTELIMKNSDQEAVEEYGVQIGKPVGEGFTRNQLLDAEDLASAVVYILTSPPHVAVNTMVVEARDQA